MEKNTSPFLVFLLISHSSFAFFVVNTESSHFLVCLSFLFGFNSLYQLNQLAVLLIFELTHLKENKTCDI